MDSVRANRAPEGLIRAISFRSNSYPPSCWAGARKSFGSRSSNLLDLKSFRRNSYVEDRRGDT